MQQCNSYGTRHGLNKNIREILCVYVCTFDNLFSLWTKHYAIANAVAMGQDMAWTKI